MSNDELIDRLKIDETVAARAPDPRRLVAIVITVLVLLLVTGWVAWWLRPHAPLVETVRPEIVDVAQGDARLSVLDASGYVVARRQATVAAEITGKLVEVNVEEGLAVEAGQVLARIDDSTERAQLALVRARLAAARSAVAEIQAELSNARRTLIRQRDLRDRDLASQAEVDRAETLVASLQARLGTQREQITVVEREVSVQQKLIERLTIRAPFSGVIIARAAQAGEMVSPISAGGGFTRTGICTIVDMDSLEIEVDVNEAYIDRVKPDQPVIARLDAYPDWEIPARVLAVVPAADRQKATVRVRIALVDRDPRILPEMGISVRFLETGETAREAQSAGPARRLTRIPAHAVLSANGRDQVFIVKDNSVERRAVRLGGRQDEQVLVSAGLTGNEQLVAHVADHDLSDGARVRVLSQ